MEMEDNNNSQYFKGLITGMCIGALIVIGTFVGFRLFTDPVSTVTPINVSSEVSKLQDLEAKMEKIYEGIDEVYLNDIDIKDMEEAVCKAMLASLGDPYSAYYTEEEYKSLMEDTSGSYCGIGVSVSHKEDDSIVVNAVFEDSPAKKAGILPGDKIVKIDDKNVAGNEFDIVVGWVRGEEGTDIELTVLRDGKKYDYKMTRKEVDVDTVSYEMKEDGIGYIKIASFDGVTKSQFKDAVDNLKEQGMEKVIIDLRDNPGGRMDVVCDIANYFIHKDDLIIYTEGKKGQKESEYATKDGELLGMPVSVIVNGNSASASELFSGVIKDYKVGKIVGTQTFGKGIAQTLVRISDGSALKLTYSKYYTPAGINIHEVGITPDEVVELPDKLISPILLEEGQEDTQLQKAIELLK